MNLTLQSISYQPGTPRRVRYDQSLPIAARGLATNLRQTLANLDWPMTQPHNDERQNPRTTRVAEIVHAAVVKLLVTEGEEAVTALRVLQETGIARSTIYRHWPDQHSLLFDTIDQLPLPYDESPVTGDLNTDLTVALDHLRRRLNKRPFRVLFATLLHHANRCTEHQPVQHRFVTTVLKPLRDILLQAQERGELPPALDLDQAVAQLAGPVLFQHIMLRTTISDELITNTTNQFLDQHT